MDDSDNKEPEVHHEWAGKLRRIKSPATQADPSSAGFPLTRIFLEVGPEMVLRDLRRGRSPGRWRGINQRGLAKFARQRVGQDASLRGNSRLTSCAGALRERWDTMADYLTDLATYCMYSPRWREAMEIAQRQLDGDFIKVNAGELTTCDLIESVATVETQLYLKSARYLIFQLGLTIDEDYRPIALRAGTDFFKERSDAWAGCYSAMLDAWNLRLRPDISVEMMALLFHALALGLIVGATTTRDGQHVRDPNGRSTLAVGIIAMTIGFLDSGDGLTTRDTLNAIVDGGRTRSGEGATGPV